MKEFTVAIHFCIVSFFNFWVKLHDLSCELSVGTRIYVLNLIWYQSLGMTRHLSYYRFILGWKNKLSKIAPSSTAPEAKNLSLNIPSLFDQQCWVRRKFQKCGLSTLLYLLDYVIYRFISLLHCILYNRSVSFTAFATTAQSPSLQLKWPLQWSFSLLSITTSGRRTWRCSYDPKDSSDSQWR